MNAKGRLHARRIHIEEDDEADDVPSMKAAHPFLRRMVIGIISVVFIAVLVVFLLSGSGYIGSKYRDIPAQGVSTLVTPVQRAFSWLTESFAGYFRQMKLRANLEEAYNEVVAENERLTYIALMAEEYQYQLSQYENMSEEIAWNPNMQMIICTIIGRSDGNYFSTFTINRGTRDGIEQYMAVTYGGALVGYTETVKENESTVRTIIDSEASIAGLIKSSRDQGTVRGTLGIDGKAMCRMYYLPDDHLPRPGDVVVTSGVGMSFPKGIPIGTVRESTRGMEANKSYIVVEPTVDFQHLERVIVLRYKPAPEAIQARGSGASREFVPLESARPYPTLRLGSMNYFGVTEAPPEESDITPSPAPTETPLPTEEPKITLAPLYTVAPGDEAFEYNVPDIGPTATPTESPTPSPTPYITLTPDELTLEDD